MQSSSWIGFGTFVLALLTYIGNNFKRK
ncbi:putative holin-like toxin [Paenibacillus macerans]